MSRRCELTGKGPIVKNKVSHSNRKSKVWMTPNIQKRRLYSDTLGCFVTLGSNTNDQSHRARGWF